MRPGSPQEAVSVGVQLMRRPDTRLRSLEDLRRTTAPALLVERARTRPDAVAFRAKKLGVYRETDVGAIRRAGRAHGQGLGRAEA